MGVEKQGKMVVQEIGMYVFSKEVVVFTVVNNLTTMNTTINEYPLYDDIVTNKNIIQHHKEEH